MCAGGALMGKDEVTARELLDTIEYNEDQWRSAPTVSKSPHPKPISKISDLCAIEKLQDDQRITTNSEKTIENQSQHEVQTITLRSETQLKQPEILIAIQEPSDTIHELLEDSQPREPQLQKLGLFPESQMARQPSGRLTSRLTQRDGPQSLRAPQGVSVCCPLPCKV